MANKKAKTNIHPGFVPKAITAAIPTDNLPALMQSLPQELFDKVFDDVFTFEHDEVVITTDYKPPPLLQVCHYSRKLFAKSYFGGGTTFIFPEGLSERWALSIVDAHFDMITSILYPMPKGEQDESAVDDIAAREALEAQQPDILLSILAKKPYLVTNQGSSIRMWVRVAGTVVIEYMSRLFGDAWWEVSMDGVNGAGVKMLKFAQRRKFAL